MLIIANIGYNWYTSKSTEDRAKALVSEAIDAGVHGVCVPVFKADKVYRNEKDIEQYRKLEMPPELLYDLKQMADKAKIAFYATPRYPEAVDYLEQIKVDCFHVGNGDINHKPLLNRLKGKQPVLLSTGYATMDEVNDAAEILMGDSDAIDAEITLLHSTGAMPTPPQEIQLGRILDLLETFMPLDVGFESFLSEEHSVLDFTAMAFRPIVVMRRIDLDDRNGIETTYSLRPKGIKVLVDMAVVMHRVNHPDYYYEGLVEGDHSARGNQLRCKDTDYTLPPN